MKKATCMQNEYRNPLGTHFFSADAPQGVTVGWRSSTRANLFPTKLFFQLNVFSTEDFYIPTKMFFHCNKPSLFRNAENNRELLQGKLLASPQPAAQRRRPNDTEHRVTGGIWDCSE